MALLGIGAGSKGEQVLHYEVPEQLPRPVRRLRLLVLVVGVLSMLSVLGALPGAVEVFDGFEQVRASLADQAEVPRLASCHAAGADLYCPAERPEEAVVDPAASCTEQGGQTYCTGEWAITVTLVALFRDSATIAANLAGLVLFALFAAAVHIPVRYLVLWRRMRRAVPTALPAVRALAWLQVAVALVPAVVVAWVFDGTEVFDGSALATGSAGLLLAPFILWGARHPEVKGFFSVHRFAPQPAAPAPNVPAGPEAWPPAPPS